MLDRGTAVNTAKRAIHELLTTIKKLKNPDSKSKYALDLTDKTVDAISEAKTIVDINNKTTLLLEQLIVVIQSSTLLKDKLIAKNINDILRLVAFSRSSLELKDPAGDVIAKITELNDRSDAKKDLLGDLQTIFNSINTIKDSEKLDSADFIVSYVSKFAREFAETQKKLGSKALGKKLKKKSSEEQKSEMLILRMWLDIVSIPVANQIKNEAQKKSAFLKETSHQSEAVAPSQEDTQQREVPEAPEAPAAPDAPDDAPRVLISAIQHKNLAPSSIRPSSAEKNPVSQPLTFAEQAAAFVKKRDERVRANLYALANADGEHKKEETTLKLKEHFQNDATVTLIKPSKRDFRGGARKISFISNLTSHTLSDEQSEYAIWKTKSNPRDVLFVLNKTKFIPKQEMPLGTIQASRYGELVAFLKLDEGERKINLDANNEITKIIKKWIGTQVINKDPALDLDSTQDGENVLAKEAQIQVLAEKAVLTTEKLNEDKANIRILNQQIAEESLFKMPVQGNFLAEISKAKLKTVTRETKMPMTEAVMSQESTKSSTMDVVPISVIPEKSSEMNSTTSVATAALTSVPQTMFAASPVRKANDKPHFTEEDLLLKLQNAISTAQIAYQTWYENPQTRKVYFDWASAKLIIHGAGGQAAAKMLSEKMRSENTLAAAENLLSKYIHRGDARTNAGSFDGYLFAELQRDSVLSDHYRLRPREGIQGLLQYFGAPAYTRNAEKRVHASY